MIDSDFFDDLPRQSGASIVFLTGAGISAESGIPTFRGPEGYWTIGSTNYQPEEMATFAMFSRMPEEVWSWYLYRRSICRAAGPNPAHLALANLEQSLQTHFLLVTQNVDGLHLLAGNTLDRCYQIHGNLDFMRCSNASCGHRAGTPDTLLGWAKERRLTDSESEQLRCPQCQSWMRPHVLWFDECYDEENYRFNSSLAAAQTCNLLVIVGSAGQTNLPMQMAHAAAARDAKVLVIDPNPSPFSQIAEQHRNGRFVQGTAGEWVERVTAWLDPRS